MNFTQLMKDLQNRIFKPVYFLQGDEPWFIDQVTDYLHDHVLAENEKAFNQMVLYGRDTDIVNIINTARRFPMMSTHLVVIVKEAQALKSLEGLEIYAANPLVSTVLVLNYKYKTLDKRTKLYKSLSEKNFIFYFPKLYEDKVPEWISWYLKQKSWSISPEAAALLTEHLGSDLSKIANELDKLALIITTPDKKINASHIEKYIGISKEYNSLELSKALVHKNALKAFRILTYFEGNPKSNPMALIISSLYSQFSKILAYHYIADKSKQNVAAVLKINPYFVSEYQAGARNYSPGKLIQIISLLREYDAKSKGSGNVSFTQGDLLKELVYKIIH